ncbi:MAG: response regulator [Sphingomonas taxi]|uniref:Response regulator n=1 Tax=Sphingomonas taxi TaxID=1549858 RepID=A0A2W5P0B5_9SPHN|nr:MAG: response regulator [Sphingomonas taxi]
MACDILVVDDNDLVRESLACLLETQGWRVRSVSGPVEAIAIMTDPGQACSVLVTDIDLGGAVDGFAVAAKVRRVSPRHPVVYVTGRPWVFEERFFDEAERTLAKPFRADDLLSAIRDIAPCLGAVR